MKLSPYVDMEEDAAVLADSMTPFRRIEDRAADRRIAEVQREIEDNPVRVSHGNLKDDVAYKLGLKAGLEWRKKLIQAAEARLKGDTESE